MDRHDIKLDNNDLFIDTNTGDLAIHTSDKQHVSDIMESVVGDYKEFPFLGVSLRSYLLSAPSEVQRLRRATRVNLENDGYTVEEFQVVENDVYINATPNVI